VTTDITGAITSKDLSTLQPVVLDCPAFVWPNVARVVPMDVFNERVIVVPDGFIPPGYKNGGIYLVQMDENDVTKQVKTMTMTHNTDGYFYHMGFWVDLNGDGRKDFLTAKSNAKVGGGQLVWYEHPEGGLETENWTEHFIASGPDIGIEADFLPQYPGEVIVFSAQFFDQQLAFYRVSLTDGSLIGSRVIDATTLSAESV
jgi:hypothetical protein